MALQYGHNYRVFTKKKIFNFLLTDFISSPACSYCTHVSFHLRKLMLSKCLLGPQKLTVLSFHFTSLCYEKRVENCLTERPTILNMFNLISNLNRMDF